MSVVAQAMTSILIPGFGAKLKAAQVAMRREMAMDGGLTATHRGKMPKAPAWSLGGGVK